MQDLRRQRQEVLRQEHRRRHDDHQAGEHRRLPVPDDSPDPLAEVHDPNRHGHLRLRRQRVDG